MRRRRASYYGNVLQRDEPHLGDEDTFMSTPGDVARFEEKPIITDANYLYTDVNADRFNAPQVDSGQEHGQPRGIDADIKPVEDLNSDISTDEAGKFYDPVLIKSFSNEEKLIEDIKRELGGKNAI
jgi:hypothetical protein